MSDFFKKSTCLFFLFLYLCLISCSNLMQDLVQHYDSGRYLEAAKSIVDGVKNPDLKPEIESFVASDGAVLLDKALYKGDIIQNDKDKEAAVTYYETLVRVLKEMSLLDIKLSNIDESIVLAEDRFNNAVSIYCQEQYKLGKQAFEEEYYRKSLEHFKKINIYKSGYKKTPDYIRKAYKSAQRYISIAPFFKKADSVTQLISDTLTGIFNNEHNPGIRKLPLNIEGVDIPSAYTRAVFNSFYSVKSHYLRFSIDDTDEKIGHTQYYIEGDVDVRIYNNSADPDRTKVNDILTYTYIQNGNVFEKDRSFEYEIMTSEFECTVIVRAFLYLTENDVKIAELFFEKPVSAKNRYRSTADNLPENARSIIYPEAYRAVSLYPDPVNKAEVIVKAVKAAAEQLVNEFLVVIDKDHDPYVTFTEDVY
ncbi:MAG: hypothetical protein GY730_02315 [bacterium]|nr:hypothetical protein [bacterium]